MGYDLQNTILYTRIYRKLWNMANVSNKGMRVEEKKKK